MVMLKKILWIISVLLIVFSISATSHAALTTLNGIAQVTFFDATTPHPTGITSVGDTFPWSMTFDTDNVSDYTDPLLGPIYEYIFDANFPTHSIEFFLPNITITNMDDDDYSGGFPDAKFDDPTYELIEMNFYADFGAWDFETNGFAGPTSFEIYGGSGVEIEGDLGQPAVVPIPGAGILFLSGVVGLVAVRRRRLK